MRWLLMIALLSFAGCLDSACVDALCVDGVPRRVVMEDVANPEYVLIALHSAGGGADQFASASQLHQLGNVSVWYPEGLDVSASDAGRTWNALHCCGTALREQHDDVALLATLVARAEAPVVLVGHSNGAMLAHRFAAEHPDAVAGLVSVGGTIGGKATEDSPLRVPPPTHAPHMRVLVIHATDDEEVRYDGGESDGRVDVAVNVTAAYWRQAGAAVEVQPITGGHAWPADGAQRIATWLA